MGIGIEIAMNKMFYILFFMSALNIIRESYFLINSFVVNGDEERKTQYKINRNRLILVSLSLSFIITCFITGITV